MELLLVLIQQMFKFHYPERGRKPSYVPLRSPDSDSVQIPLPRKGTETSYPISVTSSDNCSSNSITPKGDGNNLTVVKTVEFWLSFKFHYPERGRKRNKLPHSRSLCPVQIPLPRKGTETSNCCTTQLQHVMFKFHYPERGRKLICIYFNRKWLSTSFKFHYPERGRKPFILNAPRINSSVQIPLPRKGTETASKVYKTAYQRLCSNSITPKGDGNHRSNDPVR